MSLLDSDSEAIKKIQSKQDRAKKSSRRKKRFASLNRYSKYDDKVREKEDKSSLKKKEVFKTPPPKPEPPIEAKSETPTIDITVSEESVQVANNEVVSSLPDPILENDQALIVEESQMTPNKVIETHDDDAASSHKGNNNITKEVTLSEPKGSCEGNSKGTTKEQIGNNNVTTRVTIEEPIREQNNAVTLNVRMLTGQKLVLLNIFFQQLKRFGSREPVKFTSESLAKTSGIASETLKQVLNRLVKDGYVIRGKGKKGKGGWISITIPQSVYEQMIALESNNFNDRMAFSQDNNKVTEGVTTRVTSAPSSRNNININKNTSSNRLPENWKFIQIPDSLKAKNLTIGYIIQIANDGHFKPEEVQDILNNFAYDVEKKKFDRIGSFPSYFMKVVRVDKIHYKSAVMAEELQKEVEEYKKKMEESQELAQMAAQIQLGKKFEAEWAKLTQEQKNAIAPPIAGLAEEGSVGQERMARGNFANDPSIFDSIK